MKVTPEQAEYFITEFEEWVRLRALNNRELVQEYFQTADEGLVIHEMLMRLDPDFEKHPLSETLGH